MFDFENSIHSHLDSACRRFALEHNLAELAPALNISAQVLRNKLNSEQPHELTLSQLVTLTAITDDAAILDGLLAQLNCLPAVPTNEVKPNSLPTHTLNATAAIGAIAGETASTAPMTQSRKNAILDRANQAIRDLSLIVVSVEARFQSTPVLAAAVDVFNTCAPAFGMS
ncbi:phage regulatory CII family protein [Serratia liquefaciens]|uniref:phage regulatory CII family protein n=1 Tax=Serratia liquefaciens TaxID=614 RepID=UPI00217A8DE3|nr:phage regulatory CII family protein [Serratia liquefaciens]CAI1921394.1 Phage regulatory protein CII (CP76) [Serratia liquefaciens]